MYSLIVGTPTHRDENKLTILVRGTGLGLEILVSPSVLADADIGTEGTWYIHHHQTELGSTLFGFSTDIERGIFRQLLRVNGVGGKTAISLLGLGVHTLLQAIELQDDTLLSTVPGIGKKTAQKIIVDLKGGIDFSKKTEAGTKRDIPQTDVTIISTLVQMGYDKSRVEQVVGDLSTDMGLEEKIREAIRRL